MDACSAATQSLPGLAACGGKGHPVHLVATERSESGKWTKVTHRISEETGLEELQLE